MSYLRRSFGLLLLISCLVRARIDTTDNTQGSDGSFPADPYLPYQPVFARSLPIQILLTGISVTLSSVLMLNLCFTVQYHWPISRLNYCLQFSGLTSMMCIFITTFRVILSTAEKKSKEWPYMLDYVAVKVPPDQWSDASIAWWYGLVALATGFVHITHIQFLAMLYPSNLEAKLILALMGPLVLVSAITELIPMHAPSSSKLMDLSDAIQSVCNSTLSLLYTIALLIWGLVVNRKQAWRLEGGTAAFGGAAILLAINSTALSFVQLSRVGPFAWLTSLLHTSIVWQNFVSWWWWVGAGMSETYEDNFKMRDRKRQYKNRMKQKRKTKSSIHVFDLLWRRGTKDGKVVEVQVVEDEDETQPQGLGERQGINASGTTVGNGVARRRQSYDSQSRSRSRSRSTSASRSPSGSRSRYRSPTRSVSISLSTSPSQSQLHEPSPAHIHTPGLIRHSSDQQGIGEETGEADTTISSSGVLNLRGWWHTLRRAHLNAVRVQRLERVVIDSRRARHRQRFYESPFGREAQAMEAIAELEREERERGRGQGRGRGRRRGEGELEKNSGPLWWGPFERWRFRDRTMY